MADSTTTIHARCQCNTFHLSLTYPTSSLPHARSLCLCSSCRHLSGTSAGGSYIPLPGALQETPPATSALTAYQTSERITRYFCSTCGAQSLAFIHPIKRWSVATGLLDRTEGIVEWRGTKYLSGTVDGGVSEWFPGEQVGADGSGRSQLQMQRYLEQDTPGQEMHAGHEWKEMQDIKKGEDILKASCHCRGVQFHITRPTPESRKAHALFSDMIVPFHNKDLSPENPQHEPWFLRNANGDSVREGDDVSKARYMAGLCTCVSCRRSLGCEFQSWAFVPRVNIVYGSMATLKRYESSPDVVRSFCGTCGATVFWESLGPSRYDVVDVSTGLLDPEQGARVEDWLDWWTGRVSFREDAVSTSLVEAVEEGLKSWGKERKEKRISE
ncbi:glutathione-dependent formaldehyde-activating enzyme [Phlyctema vagabunda]|uniref:Glutathione-dependent formaldehyde-activating enzyme n=1 Tax=Phlyctema vagabunda TaxID=108571 RepID=A0ABR4PSR6_9HELO